MTEDESSGSTFTLGDFLKSKNISEEHQNNNAVESPAFTSEEPSTNAASGGDGGCSEAPGSPPADS